jgi:WD40 repeat protein
MNTKMILLCGLGLVLLLPQVALSIGSHPETNGSYCLKDRLMRVDQLIFVPPVKTVSWLGDAACTASYGAYALIGGQPFQDIDFRIYKLTEPDSLLYIVGGTHGAYVLASDWCCINGIPYVAVAGAPNVLGNEVEIYRFDPIAQTLTLAAYYSHGGIIYSVSWLCDCNSTGSGYLAIGGQASTLDRAEVRVLQVPVLTTTTTAVALQATASKVHGAPVYSVDWCASYSYPLLAIGGKTSSLECDVNIRVYSFACDTGYLYPLSQASFNGNVVNTLRWCCVPRRCETNPVLAVGGSSNGLDCANIRLYCLSDIGSLVEYAKECNHYQPTIFALDWNPACHCSYITAGGACAVATHNPCMPNIFVYKKSKPSRRTDLKLVTEEQFNQNVTSLAWYYQDGSLYSYLLVGGEPSVQLVDDITSNPVCQTEPMVILYKATYCHSRKPESVPPICMRTPLK